MKTVNEIKQITQRLEIPINGRCFNIKKPVLTKVFDFEAFRISNKHACELNYSRPYDVQGCLDSGWVKEDGKYPLLAIITLAGEGVAVYDNQVRVLVGGEDGRQLFFDMAFEHLENLPEEEMLLSSWRDKIQCSLITRDEIFLSAAGFRDVLNVVNENKSENQISIEAYIKATKSN